MADIVIRQYKPGFFSDETKQQEIKLTVAKNKLQEFLLSNQESKSSAPPDASEYFRSLYNQENCTIDLDVACAAIFWRFDAFRDLITRKDPTPQPTTVYDRKVLANLLHNNPALRAFIFDHIKIYAGDAVIPLLKKKFVNAEPIVPGSYQEYVINLYQAFFQTPAYQKQYFEGCSKDEAAVFNPYFLAHCAGGSSAVSRVLLETNAQFKDVYVDWINQDLSKIIPQQDSSVSQKVNPSALEEKKENKENGVAKKLILDARAVGIRVAPQKITPRADDISHNSETDLICAIRSVSHEQFKEFRGVYTAIVQEIEGKYDGDAYNYFLTATNNNTTTLSLAAATILTTMYWDKIDPENRTWTRWFGGDKAGVKEEWNSLIAANQIFAAKQDLLKRGIKTHSYKDLFIFDIQNTARSCVANLEAFSPKYKAEAEKLAGKKFRVSQELSNQLNSAILKARAHLWELITDSGLPFVSEIIAKNPNYLSALIGVDGSEIVSFVEQNRQPNKQSFIRLVLSDPANANLFLKQAKSVNKISEDEIKLVLATLKGEEVVGFLETQFDQGIIIPGAEEVLKIIFAEEPLFFLELFDNNPDFVAKNKDFVEKCFIQNKKVNDFVYIIENPPGTRDLKNLRREINKLSQYQSHIWNWFKNADIKTIATQINLFRTVFQSNVTNFALPQIQNLFAATAASNEEKTKILITNELQSILVANTKLFNELFAAKDTPSLITANQPLFLACLQQPAAIDAVSAEVLQKIATSNPELINEWLASSKPSPIMSLSVDKLIALIECKNEKLIKIISCFDGKDFVLTKKILATGDEKIFEIEPVAENLGCMLDDTNQLKILIEQPVLIGKLFHAKHPKIQEALSHAMFLDAQLLAPIFSPESAIKPEEIQMNLEMITQIPQLLQSKIATNLTEQQISNILAVVKESKDIINLSDISLLNSLFNTAKLRKILSGFFAARQWTAFLETATDAKDAKNYNENVVKALCSGELSAEVSDEVKDKSFIPFLVQHVLTDVKYAEQISDSKLIDAIFAKIPQSRIRELLVVSTKLRKAIIAEPQKYHFDTALPENRSKLLELNDEKVQITTLPKESLTETKDIPRSSNNCANLKIDTYDESKQADMSRPVPISILRLMYAALVRCQGQNYSDETDIIETLSTSARILNVCSNNRAILTDEHLAICNVAISKLGIIDQIDAAKLNKMTQVDFTLTYMFANNKAFLENLLAKKVINVENANNIVKYIGKTFSESKVINSQIYDNLLWFAESLKTIDPKLGFAALTAVQSRFPLATAKLSETKSAVSSATIVGIFARQPAHDESTADKKEVGAQPLSPQ